MEIRIDSVNCRSYDSFVKECPSVLVPIIDAFLKFLFFCYFQRGFVEAHHDDGLLEIFGLKQGWHASFVMVELISAKHIAQVLHVTGILYCLCSYIKLYQMLMYSLRIWTFRGLQFW